MFPKFLHLVSAHLRNLASPIANSTVCLASLMLICMANDELQIKKRSQWCESKLIEVFWEQYLGLMCSTHRNILSARTSDRAWPFFEFKSIEKHGTKK